MPKRVEIDRNLLKELFINKDYSINEIAEKLKITRNIIKHRLKDFKIIKRNDKEIRKSMNGKNINGWIVHSYKNKYKKDKINTLIMCNRCGAEKYAPIYYLENTNLQPCGCLDWETNLYPQTYTRG